VYGRELDSEIAHDDIPEDAVREIFSETPETNALSHQP
jgi:hypothetical protein